MTYSDKTIEDFQKLHKERAGKEVSKDHAIDDLDNLVGFFDLLWKMDIEDKHKEAKLKDFPKGYSFMDGKTYSCCLCGRNITDAELWYDKWGIKCLLCQKAVDTKIVPGSACKNRESRYSMWELESGLLLKSPNIRKLVRDGVLKARIVLSKTGRPHEYVFLLKDNRETLPPKNLLKGQTVHIKNSTYGFQQWYQFTEPEAVLGGYKIWPYVAEGFLVKS